MRRQVEYALLGCEKAEIRLPVANLWPNLSYAQGFPCFNIGEHSPLNTEGLTMKTIAMLAAALASIAGTAALAGPVVVTEVTSGSPGDFTYDFTFANNVGGGQYLYFFGVDDPTGIISGTPANFNTYPGFTVGSEFYNLAWLGSEFYSSNFTNTIASGSSEGGFDVVDTSLTAITSFDFFGYTYNYGAVYSGGQNYGGQPSENPVFVGTTSTGAVPEPASWALLLLGVGGAGMALRSRRRLSGLATSA